MTSCPAVRILSQTSYFRCITPLQCLVEVGAGAGPTHAGPERMASNP